MVTKSVLRPPAAHAVAGGLLEPALRGWAGCTRISPLVSCLTRRLRTETPERGLTKGSSQRVRIACVNETFRGAMRGVGGVGWIKTCANETSRGVEGAGWIKTDQPVLSVSYM